MTNGETILPEMNSFSSDTANVKTDARIAEEELPYESLDDFSTDPIGFEDVTSMISTKVEAFYLLSAKYNRRSGKYLEICGFLEKGIKYLGGCLLTKVLLENEGCSFLKLEELTMHRLYAMVSFNLRKLDAAVNEAMESSDELPSKLIDMEFRCVRLSEQLKAMQSKICDFTGINYGKVQEYFKRALMFSGKTWNRTKIQKHVKPSVFRREPAFALNREAVLEYEGGPAVPAAKENDPVRPDSVLSANVPQQPLPSDTDVSAEKAPETSSPEKSRLMPSMELPASYLIMEKAIKRSPDPETYLEFTEEEARMLLADPEFAEDFPQIASDLKKLTGLIESG